jgi:hypothetical protein
MSLQLNVTLNDADLENLVRYLAALDHLSLSDKIALMKRAEYWLRMGEKFTHDAVSFDPDRLNVSLTLDGSSIQAGISDGIRAQDPPDERPSRSPVLQPS